MKHFLSGIGALLIALGSWLSPGHVTAPDPLGAAVVTSTQLSDTINTFRTNVNGSLDSLYHALSDTTSTDPGHKHSTSTITGTFGVAAGGTGTSTYVYGVPIASGTQPFSTIAPGTANNVLQSNGTAWISSSFNGGGFPTTTISQIGETVLSSPSTTVRVSFPARQRLWIDFYSPSLTATTQQFNLTFNDDASTTYGYRTSLNNAADTVATGQTVISLSPYANTAQSMSFTGQVENISGFPHVVTIRQTVASSSPAGTNTYIPDRYETVGVYGSTSQITSVKMTAVNTGSWATSTTFTVYGSWQ
jgi:hypothetical protein